MLHAVVGCSNGAMYQRVSRRVVVCVSLSPTDSRSGWGAPSRWLIKGSLNAPRQQLCSPRINSSFAAPREKITNLQVSTVGAWGGGGRCVSVERGRSSPFMLQERYSVCQGIFFVEFPHHSFLETLFLLSCCCCCCFWAPCWLQRCGTKQRVDGLH